MEYSSKTSRGAKLGHGKRDIPAIDTVLFHSNLSHLRQKFLSDVPSGKIVLSCEPKISKRPLKRRYCWLKTKERKLFPAKLSLPCLPSRHESTHVFEMFCV